MNLQEVSDIKPCLMEAENSYPNQDEEVIHLWTIAGIVIFEILAIEIREHACWFSHTFRQYREFFVTMWYEQ